MHAPTKIYHTLAYHVYKVNLTNIFMEMHRNQKCDWQKDKNTDGQNHSYILLYVVKKNGPVLKTKLGWPAF